MTLGSSRGSVVDGSTVKAVSKVSQALGALAIAVLGQVQYWVAVNELSLGSNNGCVCIYRVNNGVSPM